MGGGCLLLRGKEWCVVISHTGIFLAGLQADLNKTVGFAGGYIQGGGHSPLSSLYGMAADHVLSFNIVTSTGHFITANPTTHPDLFWALRGGGGSTFGVVTSVTIKAFPDLPVTTAYFSLQASEESANINITTDLVWDVVKSYFLTFPTMVDSGAYSYFQLQSNKFTFYPGLFGPNLTSESVTSLLSPLIDTLQHRLKIPRATVSDLIALNITTHPSFYPAWQSSFPKEPVGGGNTQPGSRLFPRENFVNKRKFEETFKVVKEVVIDTGFFLGFNLSPGSRLVSNGKSKLGGLAKDDDTAISEHWRNSVFHAISGVFWDPAATREEIEEARDQLTFGHMKKWRDVSPDAGVYMNEVSQMFVCTYFLYPASPCCFFKIRKEEEIKVRAHDFLRASVMSENPISNKQCTGRNIISYIKLSRNTIPKDYSMLLLYVIFILLPLVQSHTILPFSHFFSTHP